MVLPGSSLAETRTVTSPTASMPSVTAWTAYSSNVAGTWTIWSIALYTASIGPVPIAATARFCPSGPTRRTVAVGIPIVPDETCMSSSL